MIRQARLALPLLAVCAAAGAALADPPVAATIPQPQPVPATIPEPAVAVVPGGAYVGRPISNYGALADNRVICKSETPTGSRLGGHSVCMTKAEWEKQSRNAQDYLNTRVVGQPGGGN